MHSARFNLPVVLSAHAVQRMAERRIDAELVLRVLEEGELRHRDATHFWAWLAKPERADHLLSHSTTPWWSRR